MTRGEFNTHVKSQITEETVFFLIWGAIGFWLNNIWLGAHVGYFTLCFTVWLAVSVLREIKIPSVTVYVLLLTAITQCMAWLDLATLPILSFNR
jgi:hypothetical protein